MGMGSPREQEVRGQCGWWKHQAPGLPPGLSRLLLRSRAFRVRLGLCPPPGFPLTSGSLCRDEPCKQRPSVGHTTWSDILRKFREGEECQSCDVTSVLMSLCRV